MTPDPTLTDEELAEWDAAHIEAVSAATGLGYCAECDDGWPCPTFRLIAALRASRKKNDRLRDGSHADIVRLHSEALEAIGKRDRLMVHLQVQLMASREEVERLNALVVRHHASHVARTPAGGHCPVCP